jgi:hypothetical protein
VSGVADFGRQAFDGAVVRRACAYAVVVGAVLIGINHGDALLAGDVDASRWWKMGLTVLVPYTVSTLSSVGALRTAGAAQAAQAGARSEPQASEARTRSAPRR